MNSENLILRTATHAPLTTKGTYLDIADFDGNNINIYEDFVNLATSSEIVDYNVGTTYDSVLEKYCTYNGRTYQYINASATMGNLPTDTDYFIEIFPTELAHQKNRDTILDEGGVDEVSANEIRSFIDAGLTSTTNLSISGHTENSLVIESSTGTDVTLLQASRTAAGLLNAANKIKLDNLSGVNSGDQTLTSLNAEDVDNKVNDFTTINSVLYPTTEAVDAYLTSQIPDLVDSALTGVEVQTNKDATGGYVGMTLFKINFKNVLNTFTSFFTNSNTAARTYTFQDRNGTIADDTDLALKAPIASPTFTGTVTSPAIILSSETASTIASFDASKNVKSLSTTTYPSLTELSYAKGVTSAIQTQIDAKVSKTSVPVIIQLAVSDETTALTTGAAKVTFRMPHAMTLTEVRASLSTAQASGTILTMDINQNGSTIFISNWLTIDNTEKTSVTASNPCIINTTSLTDDSEITIDIDQIGNGTAKGLKITLIGTRSI
jgi:hypothetical protein